MTMMQCQTCHDPKSGLSGVLTGYVDRTWARHHHPKWVAQQEAADHAEKEVAAT